MAVVSVYKSGLNLTELQSIKMGDLSQIEKLEMPVQPMQQKQQPQPEPQRPQVFHEPEVRLDKTSFVTGEDIVVHFKAPSTFARDAWVGIVPSTVPHGDERVNDRQELLKRNLNGRTSGDLVFQGPPDPGIYDIRMFNNDDGGREVASETFAVESGGASLQGRPDSGARVVTGKRVYSRGEPVEIEFAGLPGNSQDWITLVAASEPQDSFGEWFYTGGLSSGRHTFSGLLKPGSYEVRVYYDWPDGGYNVRVRQGITVSGR
jgi:hypothetical protein